MNFTALKAELIARGFDSLTDARAGVYINNARAELDRMFLWPWREKSVTGVAPVTVTDLGRIEKVINTSMSSSPLSPADYSSLVDNYGDLSIAGTPGFYYIANQGTATASVATYPTSTNVIGIQYWKVTVDLSAGADTPASPAEAHYTIIDLAARRAYRDNDEHDNAAALQPEIDNAIGQLLDQYPPGVPDGPDAYVGFTGASEDC